MANATLQLAQASGDAQQPAAGEAPADAHQPAGGAAATDAHAPAPGAHTEVAGGEHHGPFPPFDSATFPSQILWLAITFGLLYYLMSKLALPRIGGILHDRQNRLLTDIAEANRLKAESEAAAAAYEQELAQARANAAGIGQKARDSAKASAEAERAAAEAGVAERIGHAERQIAAAKTRAMKDVGSIAADAAEAIVRALVGGTVAKGDIEKAVKAELSK